MSKAIIMTGFNKNLVPRIKKRIINKNKVAKKTKAENSN